MPDFISGRQDENRIKDVSTVENCVHTLLTMRQRKDRSLLFHVLYALVTALVGYISLDGALFGIPMMLCSICLFAFPALYTYTALYSPFILKAVAIVLPIGVYSLRSALIPLDYESFVTFAVSCVGYMMCVLASIVMCRTVMGKNTKLWCFTAITVCCVICFAVMGIIFSVYTFGNVDVGMLIEKLNVKIEDFSINFKDVLTAEFSSTQGFEKFKTAIPELSDMTPEKAAGYFADTMKAMLDLLKNLIPGMFVFMCMIYGFIFTAVFSLVARIHKIPLFVCIMDKSWSYRIPLSCITFFDIILLLVIVSSIFGLPSNISMAVINLMIILLPVVLIGTFKAIYFFLSVKLKSKAAAVILCIVIATVPVMLLGFWGYLMICSVGVSLVTQRYRIECAAAKEKVLHDTETMLMLCGCKEIPKNHERNEDDSKEAESKSDESDAVEASDNREEN